MGILSSTSSLSCQTMKLPKLVATFLEKATKFFIYGILSEVLRKWYSRLPNYANASENRSGDIAELSQSTNSEQTTQKEVSCFCRCE